MSKLKIKVQYSALYRPQAIGMLERQHRCLKDSLKAALDDMGEKHQDQWLNYLPFVLMGRRTAVQPDIGASSSELAFGMNIRIPGQILYNPKDVETEESLQQMLKEVREKTNKKISQPSRHNPPEKNFPEIPNSATHAYTKQHQVTGLSCPYEGPFKIAERLSNSTVKLEVGLYKDGSIRYEIRHLNDLKFAHPDSLTAPAQRPKLGRPSGSASDASSIPTELPPVREQRQPETAPNNRIHRLSRFPNPPLDNSPGAQNSKQNNPAVGTKPAVSHETSNTASRVPASTAGNPAQIQTSNRQPPRSTRNPKSCQTDRGAKNALQSADLEAGTVLYC